MQDLKTNNEYLEDIEGIGNGSKMTNNQLLKIIAAGGGGATSGEPSTGKVTPTGGEYNATPPTYSDGDVAAAQYDENGNQKVVEQYAPAYEDNTAGVAKVEHQYESFRVTASGLVKSGSGFVHVVNVNPTTATPTAGLLTIYDSTTGSGTILHTEWVFETSAARSIILDKKFGTGLYISYDATLADVSVDGSYR